MNHLNRRELLKLAAGSALLSALPMQSVFAQQAERLVVATPLAYPR